MVATEAVVARRTLENLSGVQIRAWVAKRKLVAKSDGRRTDVYAEL